MNQNKLRLYGILVDISGSMIQSYSKIKKGVNQLNQIRQPDKIRLFSVWQIIKEAFQNNHSEDDYIFLSAFGCHNDIDVIDLTPFIISAINILNLKFQLRRLQLQNHTHQKDYQQLLYEQVKNNGANNLSNFYSLSEMKNDISYFKAKLLYNSFKENKIQQQSFIQQLPKQVKKNKPKYQFQAMLGRSFKHTNTSILNQNPITKAIQKNIQDQLITLDNYIPYDLYFEAIQQYLNEIITKINNSQNQYVQLQNNLNLILSKLKAHQKIEVSEKLKLLETILNQIERQQNDILEFLNKECFNPEDLIKQQTNISEFQIHTIKKLRELQLISIGEDRFESDMITEDLSLLKQFESIAYGGTPLVKCLKFTLNSQFQQFENKFLFIVSDGDSTDGNPIEYAQRLKDQGFSIFCFYISSKKKAMQNQLYSKMEFIKGDGAKTMFELSSEYSNFEFPLRQIQTYTNIQLSEEGKSRLFLQNNDLEQLKQFFDYFMKISKDFDKLIETIGQITLEKYINSNKDFQPKQQYEKTCYAYSIATVYSIMMSKIYKREGEYPGFFRIRDLLIQQYGIDGANTFTVVQETCKDFRLQCRILKTIPEIKQALHKGRPIISRFQLCEDQWNAANEDQIGFHEFFRRNPQGILSSVGPQSNKQQFGHAVVLYSYTKDYYLFINSWGTNWGDKGYFKVKDLDVLNMQLMEVFWNQNDLTESEKNSFKQDAGQEITKFYQLYLRSIGDINYTCPKCSQQSFINLYNGNYYEAQCPKCNENFHPQSLGQLFVDYLNGRNI